MITGLDHLVVLVRDLDAGVAVYQTMLGVAPAWRTESGGAASALFTLPNVSLELMAPKGEGEATARVNAVLDAQGEGLVSLCFRVSDIDKMRRRLNRLAMEPEAVTDGGASDATSGVSLAWRRTRTTAHGVRLFFLQMQGERPESQALADAPMIGLDHVVVTTHQPERAAALYGARLGLDMALDRSHADWGRLMFFRCGDLIVEVVQRPGQTDTNAPDKLWGLSWRTADIDATRERLVAAGVEASQVRDGRKPGTRVMSLRSGTLGVPTLVLQPAPLA